MIVDVVMISRSVYEWDIRVRREARALASAGHRVTFIGLPSRVTSDGNITLIGLGEPSNPQRTYQRPRSPWYRLGRWMLLPEHRERVEQRFQREVLETAIALDLDADVIHAHDFPALEPAIQLSRQIGAKVVYDSHEYWAGRPRRGRPEPWRRVRRLKREAELARQADAVIMVSEHGAELMAMKLGLAHVHVVRNTFSTRDDLVAPTQPTGAVYAGRIAPQRDLDTVFDARIWREPGMALHVMGQVDDVKIPEWVVRHPMGSMESVDLLLIRVGIGLVTMTNKYINHRIALPNKLFQSISVGVPVVAADTPQTAVVVREHGLGELYEPGNTASLEQAVRSVIDNYESFRTNVADARPLFDWSVDATRLVELYGDLERSGQRRRG